MPFKSRAQQRAAFASKIPGINKEQAKEWASKTDFKKLPEKVAMQQVLAKLVPELAMLLKTAALGTAQTAKSKDVGRFSGFATEDHLKAPGMAAQSQAINPRRSLSNAISTFKA